MNVNRHVYDFHFIMDEQMKDELMGLDMYSKSGSFSGLIVEILLLLLPRIEREHFFGKERMSCYELVHEDDEVIRENVHVYMPGDLYRHFKLMHQDLNFYSMAQLIRLFLRWFLDLVNLYGDNFGRELEKLMKKMEEENKTKCLSWEKLLQLWQLIYQKPYLNKLLSIYNSKFSPARIFRL